MPKPSLEPPGQQNHPILLYDGVCGLCNRAVQFVLKRDRHHVFRFAALQSDVSATILRKHGFAPDALDTLYLVLNCGEPGEQLSCRSDAALAILRRLGGIWRVLAALGGFTPSVLRDFVYNRVARNRYRIFGKHESCPIPTPEQRARFLDQ